MSDKAKIKDSIRKMFEGEHDGYSVLCNVESVDLTDMTCYCIPVNGDPDILGVKLMANLTTGFLMIPEVGSKVIVSYTGESSAFVSMFSDVSEIRLNGVNYGGLALTGVLQTKLNTLEGLINNLKTAIAAINTAGTGSPGTPVTNSTLMGFFTSFPPLPALVPTTQTEISNSTVKHGNG